MPVDNHHKRKRQKPYQRATFAATQLGGLVLDVLKHGGTKWLTTNVTQCPPVEKSPAGQLECIRNRVFGAGEAELAASMRFLFLTPSGLGTPLGILGCSGVHRVKDI